MILQDFIEISVSSKNFAYYKEKGYEFTHKKDKILVKLEDVPDGSGAEETRKCDKCGVVFTRKHKAIMDTYKAHGKDLCVKCSKEEVRKKIKETCLKKYGVEYPMQSKEIKEKAKATTREHYGVDFSFQNKEINEIARNSFKEKYNADNPYHVPEIKEKAKQIVLEKYGVENVFQNEDIKKKSKETNLQKYGVEYVTQNNEVKDKIKKTNLEKYGVEHVMQNKDIQAKFVATITKNGNTPTSSQQIKIYEMCKELFPNYQVELNYPEGLLILDIKMTTDEGQMIDIEYDGWPWHLNRRQKDYGRDVVVNRLGYKVIRIRSGALVPTKEQLLEAVNYVLDNDKNFSSVKLEDWIKAENSKNKNKDNNKK